MKRILTYTLNGQPTDKPPKSGMFIILVWSREVKGRIVICIAKSEKLKRFIDQWCFGTLCAHIGFDFFSGVLGANVAKNRRFLRFVTKDLHKDHVSVSKVFCENANREELLIEIGRLQDNITILKEMLLEEAMSRVNTEDQRREVIKRFEDWNLHIMDVIDGK
jgi:hypothetical protein